MGGKIAMAAAVLVLAGLAWTGLRAETFPNVPMAADGESVTVDQARGDRGKLVLALIMPTDPVSKAVVEKLKAEYPAYEGRATFAALMLSDPASAAAYQKAHYLPFTVYSLAPQEHAIEYNEVVKTVGGFRKRFFVGTVVMLDRSRKISQQVNGDEAEHLSATLQKL